MLLHSMEEDFDSMRRGLANSMQRARRGFPAHWMVFGRGPQMPNILAPLRRGSDIEERLICARVSRQASRDVGNVQRMRRPITGKLQPPGTLPMPGVWADYLRVPNWRGPRRVAGAQRSKVILPHGRLVVRCGSRCVGPAAGVDAELRQGNVRYAEEDAHYARE